MKLNSGREISEDLNNNNNHLICANCEHLAFLEINFKDLKMQGWCDKLGKSVKGDSSCTYAIQLELFS